MFFRHVYTLRCNQRYLRQKPNDFQELCGLLTEDKLAVKHGNERRGSPERYLKTKSKVALNDLGSFKVAVSKK